MTTWAVLRHKRYRYQARFFILGLLVSLADAAIRFLRADYNPYVGMLTRIQLIDLAIAVLFFTLLVVGRSMPQRKNSPLKT